jgi:opacity protein-like surface antigen
MRKLAVLFSCVVALSFLRCVGAWAQPALDPLEDHLNEARETVNTFSYYHEVEDEPSPFDEYCDADELYRKLSDDFDTAVATGDVLAASALADTLGNLGEELEYDEWVADQDDYDDDSCFCRYFDEFGPHTAFVEGFGGWTDYNSGTGDSTGYNTGAIWGIGVGMTVPLPQQNTYLIGTLGGYGMSGSTQLFGPGSTTTAKTPWVAYADAGAGVRLPWLPIDLHVLVGVAATDLEVRSPAGTVSKTQFGPTFDIGSSYPLSKKLTVDLDYRFVDFGNPTYNPAPGVAFRVNQIQSIITFGLRYQLGSTVR